MKSYKQLFPLVLVAIFGITLLVSGCNDDDNPVDETGTLTVNVNINVDGTPLALNDVYTDPTGKRLKITDFKFYLSNLEVVDQSGLPTQIKEVELVDASDAATQTMSAEIPVGTYHTLQFGVGLDEVLNASDPSDFDASSPLSTLAQMYWSWASKYIFLKMDGYGDSTGTGSLSIPFVYHTGLDSLYFSKSFASQNIAITAGQTTTYTISLDLMKVFYGANDTIDYTNDNENFTHTTGNFDLAERVTTNLMSAIE